MMIQDARALLGALRRLQTANDAVIFWNAEGSFKLMLRNDASEALETDPDSMGWDLSIVWDEDEEDDDANTNSMRDVGKVLQLEPDGFLDEPGTFIVDSGSLDLAAASEALGSSDCGGCCEDLRKVMAAVNKLHACTVCPCGKYLIKDAEASCIVCHMTSAPGDVRSHFCAICQCDGARRHMAQQPCCGQYLHVRCLSGWTGSWAGTPVCPLCRASTTPPST